MKTTINEEIIMRTTKKPMKHGNGALLALALLVAALTATHARGQSTYTPYTFITLAGNPGYGSADGTNSGAQFAFPCSVAVDSAGNVYVADTVNCTIREMTPGGVVTTLAGLAGCTGTNDGTGSAARFNYPNGVAVDSAGNLYVADTGNHTIREVTPVGTNWVVTTLAGLAGNTGSGDGTNSAARFNGPGGVAVDTSGNVYVADSENHTIREVTPVGTNWVVTTLAGLAGYSGNVNATGSNARFYLPFGLTVAPNGTVYVADEGNNVIRKVTPSGTNWIVTTAWSGGLNWPAGVAVDSAGNLYVANTDDHTIGKVSGGVGTILAGGGSVSIFGTNDGTGSAARFYYPDGVAVDTNGTVYVADSGNGTIRKVTPAGMVTTLAGLAGNNTGSTDGTGSAARFDGPLRVAVDANGNLYVSDLYNQTIRQVTPVGTNWVVTTLAGLAGSAGSANGTNSAARFNGPDGVALDSAGNLYVSDYYNDTIRKVTPVGTNWVVTTLAGLAGSAGSANGTNSAARFNGPQGVAVDSAGNLYVADYNNNTIREVTPVGTNWVVTTLAGLAGSGGSANGTNSAARFNGPNGVAVDSAGNLYVADYNNNTIREITPVGTSWVVTTLAGLAGHIGSADGTNNAARFAYPSAVVVDSVGNLYVTDNGDYTIRKVTPVGTNWVVTTVAGLPGYIAEIDGTGSAARFNSPVGVAVDSAGNLYVADWGNSTIRKGFPANSVPTPMLQPPSLNAGQFGFGITGLPGLAVNIEASGDLSIWQVVGTCLLEGGTNSFVNPNPSLGAQFYRAHVR
jgi:sugar lactone lactonase YvrE